MTHTETNKNLGSISRHLCEESHYRKRGMEEKERQEKKYCRYISGYHAGYYIATVMVPDTGLEPSYKKVIISNHFNIILVL